MMIIMICHNSFLVSWLDNVCKISLSIAGPAKGHRVWHDGDMIMGKTFRVVVCGTKECGKTSIIERAIYNRSGVSYLDATIISGKQNILIELLKINLWSGTPPN